MIKALYRKKKWIDKQREIVLYDINASNWSQKNEMNALVFVFSLLIEIRRTIVPIINS